MYRGLETYKQDASWGKGIKEVLSPYAALMQQHNIDPMVQVKGLMNAHYTLATGSPAEKGALLGKLLVDYKIDPNTVPVPGGEAPFEDPEVKALRERTARLESAEAQRAAEHLEAVKTDLNQRIDKFFADPANIYVGEVGHDMAQLIQSGVAKDLDDAYQRAIWANPVTRDKEISRKFAEDAAKATAEREKKAEEARKASSANVRARAKSGSPTAPVGTMDDTMNATLAAIRAREG